MTDNEIIKALECCYKGGEPCENCPLKDDDRCNDTLMGRYALDLIRRQKAETERRKNNLFCKVVIDEETMRNIVKEKVAEFELDIASIRAEAIKEFAEIIKDRYPNKYVVWGGGAYGITFENFIDNLVKEMVGE